MRFKVGDVVVTNVSSSINPTFGGTKGVIESCSDRLGDDMIIYYILTSEYGLLAMFDYELDKP